MTTINNDTTYRIRTDVTDYSEKTSKASAINLVLGLDPGNMTINEIARKANTKRSAVYNHLRALVEQGKLEVLPGAQGRTESGDAGYFKGLLEQARTTTQQLKAKYVTQVEHLEGLVRTLRAEAENNKQDYKVLKLDFGDREVEFDANLVHEKFEQILQLAAARMNIFLYGPTGSGKSYICAQVAEALNLPFYGVNCTSGMSETVLTGKLLPLGEGGMFEYMPSEFVEAYENGGVFLMDEMDAADPNVLLVMNTALANTHISLPNRPEKPRAERHPDFICIAAANTLGTGADRMYSGRNQLDGSTLDRFNIGKVKMDYDTRVEAQLCPDEELRKELTDIRTKIDEYKLERAMSTRFMKDAYTMKQVGWSLAQIKEAFFMGWRKDEINKVAGGRR